ncbi:transposase, partial [Desulfobotulus mexicanus]
MAKPITGKTHIGERREKRANGDIYIYERVTAYDEKAKKTYTVSQKLKGKIKQGTQEVVVTRPKKNKGEGGIADATRQHTGLTDILEWVGKASGIDDDVRASFSEGDAAKILSIARYWIGSGGNTLPRLESWQVMHPLPYREAISEDVYGKLFKDVGRNEEGVQCYFSARAARLAESPVLAFDSTTVSTYSENQSEARQGFNKDGDGLNTIKLLTLYSVKAREPIAFTKQPGNIPD